MTNIVRDKAPDQHGPRRADCSQKRASSSEKFQQNNLMVCRDTRLLGHVLLLQLEVDSVGSPSDNLSCCGFRTNILWSKDLLAKPERTYDACKEVSEINISHLHK